MTSAAPVLAIVQARMGSTRLPGKVLAPLAGTTVLGLLLTRLARSQLVDAVVVATTTSPDDEAVAREAERHGALAVRGPVDDVLSRFVLALDAATGPRSVLAVPPVAVVRLTADCPLTDPALVDAAIAPVTAGAAEVVTNGTDRYLRGFDVEVCTADALRRAAHAATPGPERIHVTPWLYAHRELFRVLALPWPADHAHLRLTVDTPEDLAVVRAVCDRLGDPTRATWQEAAAVLEADPALAAHNADVRQKTVEEG